MDAVPEIETLISRTPRRRKTESRRLQGEREYEDLGLGWGEGDGVLGAI